MSHQESPLDRRRAGLLLHPTSLPGGVGNGDLGSEAYRFVDFLAESGFTVWQTLPLGPPHRELSPYRCQSVHAGSEQLISLELLMDRGWLVPDDGPALRETPREYRKRRLGEAHQGFNHHAAPHDRVAYSEFISRHGGWLDDYALFRSLRWIYQGAPWWRWPVELRHRNREALNLARERHIDAVEQIRFEQYLFFSQWYALRDHANRLGILVFGDIPLFVAEDSADVWAQREYFRVDGDGLPEVVAGVPPDYFSATGQRWGNPHYAWERMEEDGFQWWIERIRTQLEQFDLLRIDHFRGLESFWEIGPEEDTAIHGNWVKAPGAALLQTLRETFEKLPLVAEDLGIITPEVEALRDRFGLPGMKILQFAFGEGEGNPYLPHNHRSNTVAYSGTHDNNTSLGWFQGLAPEVRQQVLEYLDCGSDQIPEALCRAVFASVARLAIIPMQDLLHLGAEHRMNTPGIKNGNWEWRFSWEEIDPGLSMHYRRMMELYGRSG